MWIQLNSQPTNVARISDDSGSTAAEKGFSLIEVVIALLIIMIALLGVFHAVTYAIVYNYGNKTRGQALSVMQQEVELLRSKKFTLAFTDPDLVGGTRTKTVTTTTGETFEVQHDVDNEPLVDGIQDEDYECLTPQEDVIPCSFKEITITVRLAEETTDWRAAVPPKVVLRRTRGN